MALSPFTYHYKHLLAIMFLDIFLHAKDAAWNKTDKILLSIKFK